jgi:hypothetical protein
VTVIIEDYQVVLIARDTEHRSGLDITVDKIKRSDNTRRGTRKR